MQTLKEKQFNVIVFPYSEIPDPNPFAGLKNVGYMVYAYDIMANDPSGSFGYGIDSGASVSVGRWWSTDIGVNLTPETPVNNINLIPGTTYQLEFRYGIQPEITWKLTDTIWKFRSDTWSSEQWKFDDNYFTIGESTVFISGSVAPAQRFYVSENESINLYTGSEDITQKIYISSNEDALLKIYQG